MEKDEYIRLKLKVLIKTDECFLVDLGTGKVWLDLADVRSRRRVKQGIYEMEIRREVIDRKRREMRGLKEKATGVKGSVLGEVVEMEGKILREEEDAYQIEADGKSFFFPRFCFSEMEQLGEDRWRFVLQRDFYEFKLRVLENLDPAISAFSEVQARIVQETDRAYCLSAEGREFWYPKRGVLETREMPDSAEKIFRVPTDFWKFKLTGGY